MSVALRVEGVVGRGGESEGLRLTLEVADVLEGVCRSTETGTRRSTDSKE